MSKKGLTSEGRSDIIIKLSARAHGSAERGRGSLKTIQKQEETRTGGRERERPGTGLREDSQFGNEREPPEDEDSEGELRRIQHESLILAQDERWRRA